MHLICPCCQYSITLATYCGVCKKTICQNCYTICRDVNICLKCDKIPNIKQCIRDFDNKIIALDVEFQAKLYKMYEDQLPK